MEIDLPPPAEDHKQSATVLPERFTDQQKRLQLTLKNYDSFSFMQDVSESIQTRLGAEDVENHNRLTRLHRGSLNTSTNGHLQEATGIAAPPKMSSVDAFRHFSNMKAGWKEQIQRQRLAPHQQYKALRRGLDLVWSLETENPSDNINIKFAFANLQYVKSVVGDEPFTKGFFNKLGGKQEGRHRSGIPDFLIKLDKLRSGSKTKEGSLCLLTKGVSKLDSILKDQVLREAVTET